MPEIFVDTAGWGNICHQNEPFHQVAVTLYRNSKRAGTGLVTTNYVLAELVSLLTSPVRLSHQRIVEFVSVIKTSPYVEIVRVTPAVHELAWQLYKNRPDKQWSLVDCSSMVVMQQRAITNVLTADHDSEQAGITILLK